MAGGPSRKGTGTVLVCVCNETVARTGKRVPAREGRTASDAQRRDTGRRAIRTADDRKGGALLSARFSGEGWKWRRRPVVTVFPIGAVARASRVGARCEREGSVGPKESRGGTGPERECWPPGVPGPSGVRSWGKGPKGKIRQLAAKNGAVQDETLGTGACLRPGWFVARRACAGEGLKTDVIEGAA